MPDTESLPPSGRAYWAMRTDRNNRALILDELRLGILRQGWGYDAVQDLRLLVGKHRRGESFIDKEKDAWRNRPMLGGAHGIKQGDIVLLPNLPRPGQFLLVEVEGPYRFEPIKLDVKTDINDLGQDYGHILPVKKVEKPTPIPMQDEQLHAGLRASLTCRSRLWSIADYGQNIEELLVSPRSKGTWNPDRAFQRLIDNALTSVQDQLESEISSLLTQRFSRAELEIPCKLVLEHFFPGAAVEHRGGPMEHGADIIVTWDDPLATSGSGSSLSWRAVFQIKAWENTAYKLRAINQLVEAVRYYGDEYPIRGAYLLTLCDGEEAEFKKHREAMSKELNLPIQFIGRKHLLGLIRQYALARITD